MREMKQPNKHDTAQFCISAIRIVKLTKVLDLIFPHIVAWRLGVWECFGQNVFLVFCVRLLLLILQLWHWLAITLALHERAYAAWHSKKTKEGIRHAYRSWMFLGLDLFSSQASCIFGGGRFFWGLDFLQWSSCIFLGKKGMVFWVWTFCNRAVGFLEKGRFWRV